GRTSEMKSEAAGQMHYVVRLELRKTFFARRGLWIYLLAFAPVVLFFANSVYSTSEKTRLARLGTEHPVSKEALSAVQVGQTREQVIAALGQPYRRNSNRFRIGPQRDGTQMLERDNFRYTDGETDVNMFFDN